MRTIFEMGLRKGLGQIPGPYMPPVSATTPAVPPPPPPPERPGSTAHVIDEATRRELLDIMKATKAQRRRIAAWWDANPKAREILGEKMKLYSQYLTESMAYDELVERLDFRLSQGPGAYIKDYEIEDLRAWQDATDKLVMVVEGKADVPAPPPLPGTTEGIVWPSGIALAAFAGALLL